VIAIFNTKPPRATEGKKEGGRGGIGEPRSNIGERERGEKEGRPSPKQIDHEGGGGGFFFHPHSGERKGKKGRGKKKWMW